MADLKEERVTLALILGATDGLWEPDRADSHRCGSNQQRLNARSNRWQARERYRSEGVLHLPADRSWRGRQATADLLAGLSSQGLIEVRASSGKPARVKLTLAGCRYIRRLCGFPTLASSAGLFVKLLRLWNSKALEHKAWKRYGCVWELALIHPNAAKSYSELGKRQLGTLLLHLAPWLAHEFIRSHETTYGWAYLAPTLRGLEYFDGLDQSAIEPDWEAAFQVENRAMLDAGELTVEEMIELAEIANDTFTRERAAQFAAIPEDRRELGEIAWSASD